MNARSSRSVPTEGDDFLDQKVIESQKLGFKLVEEVRNLRNGLVEEKQKIRVLIVTNANLEEQIVKVEDKNEDLVRLLRAAELDCRQVTHKLDLEKAHKIELEEEIHRMQHSIERYQSKLLSASDREEECQQSLLQKDHDYQKLLTYSNTLEVALNKMAQECKLLDELTSVERSETLKLLSLQKTEKIAWQEILAKWSTILQLGEYHGNAKELLAERADRLLVLTRQALEEKSHSVTKSKKNIQQLKKIITVYEEMMPLQTQVQTQQASSRSRQLNSRHRQSRRSVEIEEEGEGEEEGDDYRDPIQAMFEEQMRQQEIEQTQRMLLREQQRMQRPSSTNVPVRTGTSSTTTIRTSASGQAATTEKKVNHAVASNKGSNRSGSGSSSSNSRSHTIRRSKGYSKSNGGSRPRKNDDEEEEDEEEEDIYDIILSPK